MLSFENRIIGRNRSKVNYLWLQLDPIKVYRFQILSTRAIAPKRQRKSENMHDFQQCTIKTYKNKLQSIKTKLIIN